MCATSAAASFVSPPPPLMSPDTAASLKCCNNTPSHGTDMCQHQRRSDVSDVTRADAFLPETCNLAPSVMAQHPSSDRHGGLTLPKATGRHRTYVCCVSYSCSDKLTLKQIYTDMEL
ncbi:uncharacterized protein V6R79_003375 [Siganus canaliculatus]